MKRPGADDCGALSARKALVGIILKYCPSEIDIELKSKWAQELEAAVYDHCSGDMKESRKRIMSLTGSLRSNGSHLSQFLPSSLATMSLVDLNSGTAASIHRFNVANGLDGWEGSTLEPQPSLLASSHWFSSGCKLVLVAYNNTEVSSTLRTSFGETEGVHVIDDNILCHDGLGHCVDAFVSPANTIGNMDGGIDRIYADHFKWPYGRPYKDENPLQQEIDEQYGLFKQLPIGQAVLVPVSYRSTHTEDVSGYAIAGTAVRSVRYLIAAPTMVRPEAIEKGSRIIYEASLAAFRLWRRSVAAHDIKSVAMPSFGTGYGNVPPVIAAKQMWEAFVVAWSEN